MKIAIIRQRYNPHGGAERFVSRALTALSSQQNVEMHLIARRWEAVDGIQFHRCDPFYLERLSRDFGFALQACRIARNLDVDLIQSHERLACCDIYRAGDGLHRTWLKQRGRVLPAWRRALLAINPYHLYLQWAEKRLFESKRLKAVICNSQMVKNEILEHFQIDADKIHIIRNGIDCQSFHPDIRQQKPALRQHWQLPQEAPVFVFVGSGFERKGLKPTLTALAQVPDAYLVVVGHDKRLQHYQQYARRLDIQQRVIFAGPQRDVKPFYALADAFVLPTLYDPFPNAALEALACGLPVITSQQSGAAEVIEHGVSGFVCDALETNKIATAMDDLTSLSRAKHMGDYARRAAEDLDWQHISGELVKLFESLQKSQLTP